MLRSKQTMFVIFLIAVSFVGIYMVGCDSTSVDSNKIDVTTTDSDLRSPSQETLGQYIIGNDSEQEVILDDSQIKSSILNSVLNQSSFAPSVNNAVS